MPKTLGIDPALSREARHWASRILQMSMMYRELTYRELTDRLLRIDLKDIIESPAGRDHSQVLIQGDQGIPDGIDDALGIGQGLVLGIC